MIAWNLFCATDECKNALRWSMETKYEDGRPIDDFCREEHAKGAMWIAFISAAAAVRKEIEGRCQSPEL